MLTFDGSTGLLKSVANLENSLTVSLSQTLQYYTSFAGNNSEGKFWSSGAYAFRPASDQPTDIASVVKTTLVVVSEGLTVYCNKVTIIIVIIMITITTITTIAIELN